MLKRLTVGWFLFVSLFMTPLLSQADTSKPVLNINVVFANEGSAKLSYDIHGATQQDGDSSKIEAAMVLYAVVMNKLDTNARKALINQVQTAVSKVATEQGLVRADIIKDNPLLKPLAQGAAGKQFSVVFSEVAGQGHTLEVNPSEIEATYLTGGLIYLFQDLIQKLPDSGVRFMVLAMGGMNKYYRDGADPSDPASLSKAPSYALNLAADIIQKVSSQGGQKK
jgi:hypothetical protein